MRQEEQSRFTSGFGGFCQNRGEGIEKVEGAEGLARKACQPP